MNHFGMAIGTIAATVIAGAFVLDRATSDSEKTPAPANVSQTAPASGTNGSSVENSATTIAEAPSVESASKPRPSPGEANDALKSDAPKKVASASVPGNPVRSRPSRQAPSPAGPAVETSRDVAVSATNSPTIVADANAASIAPPPPGVPAADPPAAKSSEGSAAKSDEGKAPEGEKTQ